MNRQHNEVDEQEVPEQDHQDLYPIYKHTTNHYSIVYYIIVNNIFTKQIL